MLDVHRFDYASEAQVVDEFLGELKDVIARSIDRSTSGQFALAKQREVSFLMWKAHVFLERVATLIESVLTVVRHRYH
ncbi:hypothetical protein JCM19233_95 [Vibrio astriarenae]|nr:hypothetical protein JCM19233_95 [Vibrio sp. C7]